jgi:hypothetical protein
MKFLEQLMYTVAGFHIKVTGWFISQQQLRLHYQSPCYGNPLLLAAGEFARLVGDTMAKPDLCQY